MTETRVAVVILNYNGKHFLEKFLPSLLLYSQEHELYVADNNSSDDSVVFLQTQYPAVKVLLNQGNFGYAKGYNEALKKVGAEYYILLNSDVEVTENWIEPVIGLMKQNPLIAACQPKILDHGHRHHFEYAGASGGYIDKYGYPFCRGRIFNSLEEDHAQFNTAEEIFWASGACLFVNSKAFWQVGGFDGDYFAHMEEIDLCWRLKNMGYQVFVQPASVIYHIGGGTLNKLSSAKTFLNFRNNLTTLTKNHPAGFLLPKVIYRLLLDGVAAFKFLFEGQPKHFWAVLRAHFAFYSWLPAIVKKRNHMKKLRGFRFSRSHMYRGNIVLEYFLKGKQKFSELKKGYFSS